MSQHSERRAEEASGIAHLLCIMTTVGVRRRGRSTLVCGGAGSGKTLLALEFTGRGIMEYGEPCVFIACEEAPVQVIRKMSSISFDPGQWVRKRLLKFHGGRSTLYGLEQHRVTIRERVNEFRPSAVVVDPITNLMVIGEPEEVKSMLTRMIAFLKSQGLTAIFTGLTEGGGPAEQTEMGVSSLMDTWPLLRHVEYGAERNRLLFVLKSRGMAHSNRVRAFRLTNRGIQLADVYVGPGTVLAGSARLVQEARDRAQAASERRMIARRRRKREQEQALARAQLEALPLKTAALDEEIQTRGSAEETVRRLPPGSGKNWAVSEA